MKFKVKRRKNDWHDTYTLEELLTLILQELDSKADGPECYNCRSVEREQSEEMTQNDLESDTYDPYKEIES